MWGATTKSNDIFDKLNTSIDRLGRRQQSGRRDGQGQKSSLHNAPESEDFRDFHQFWHVLAVSKSPDGGP
jgi:hypothetical protein